jgi:pimeloyl-ACP methyl ester carboxylesterase/sugar lactone lactonase YvrE
MNGRARRSGRLAASAMVAGALCVGSLVALPAASAAAAGTAPALTHVLAATTTSSAKPTIVMVHGAFADASGWDTEIADLTRLGYPVLAPANPLRGVASDAAYLDGVLATIPGPVVLVGHSYGGAVIAAAANKAPNVKALVYVSAFIPEKARAASYYTDKKYFPGSLLGESDALTIRPTYNPTLPAAPTAPGTTPNPTAPNDADVYINPARFRAIFAADRTKTQAAVMAAAQRPVSGTAYNEPTGPAAKLPSWDLVSLDDKAIPPAAQQYMAQRAGARVTAIHSAHDSLITHPKVVDKLIVQAATSIRTPATKPTVLSHLSLSGGQRPENVATEPDGDLDVTMSQAAQVVRVTPTGKETVLASLPRPADGGKNVPVVGFALATGLVRSSDGTLFVGYAAGSADLNGIWRVRPRGKPERIIALPANSFPNGLAIEGKHLYFTDSTRGLILKAPVAGGSSSTWFSGPETKISGTYGLGANGLKIHRGAVWITNFDQGTLLRIPIKNGRAGGVQTRARLAGGPDDFIFVNRHSDTVIAALDPGNQVVRINHDGSYHTLLTAADGLQGPTSVAKVGSKLYVFSAAYITTTDPNILVSTHNR